MKFTNLWLNYCFRNESLERPDNFQQYKHSSFVPNHKSVTNHKSEAWLTAWEKSLFREITFIWKWSLLKCRSLFWYYYNYIARIAYFVSIHFVSTDHQFWLVCNVLFVVHIVKRCLWYKQWRLVKFTKEVKRITSLCKSILNTQTMWQVKNYLS